MQYIHTLSVHVAASEWEAVLYPRLVTIVHVLKYVLAVLVFLHL